MWVTQEGERRRGAYMVFWVVVSSTERVVSSDATAKWPAVCGEKRTARTLGEECGTRGRCQGADNAA